jgi:hypothetical protein
MDMTTRHMAFLLFVLVGGTACAAFSRQTEKSAIAVTWRRDCGIAGFCDEMQIFTNGEVKARSCRGNADKTVKLSSEDLNRLNTWRKRFGNFDIDSNQRGVADGLNVTLSLKGTGSGRPTDAERQEISQWTERVYQTVGNKPGGGLILPPGVK